MNRQKFISALTIGLVSMTASAKRLLKLPPQQLTGGGCDGCDLIYQGMPAKLSNTTYLPDWHEAEAKMIVEGTIYFKDGSTPAPGVIFYLYHTDSTGHYSKAAGQVHGLRHGHIRGWIKTGNDGKYWFYTGKPAAYPNRDIPAHIHPVIKQPGMNEYYLDDYFFNNDPLLTPTIRAKAENRGGSGMVTLSKNNSGILVCRRDIILGLNIPNYHEPA